MNDGKMRNFDMATGNSGAKDTCWYDRKEYPKDSRAYTEEIKRRREGWSADYGLCAVYGESDNLRLVEI